MQKFKALRRVIAFALPFWRRILWSIILSVFTIGSSVGLMATSAWLISKSGLQPSIADLGISVVGVRFFGLSRAFFRYLERLVSHDVTFRLLASLRVWFYRAVEPLAPARLARYRSGDLLGRVVSDIETLENVYTRVIAPPVVALIIALVTTLLFASFDPLVALVFVAFVLLASTIIPAMAWWLSSRPGKAVVQDRAELNTMLVDLVQGLPDSLAYGYSQQQIAEFNRISEQLDRIETRLARLESLQEFLAVLAVQAASVAVLIVAIPRIDGLLLATVALATVAAFEAITPLATAAHHLTTSAEAADRLFEIVDAEPQVEDPATPEPVARDYTLTVEDLTFRYELQIPPVLDDFSLRVPEGARVAIVGPSGAGKSTLVQLLLRFWDPVQGTIRIGGYDLRAYQQETVHQFYGVMSQRTHLFNTTIMENIRIARPAADDASVIEAAQQAQIHDFIEGLPQGYDTYAGEGGALLSGGERQRIALARALLKDSPILILDEATANLDAISEQAVLKAILTASQGRSLLMITHRLTMLDLMDHIVVLSAGRIVEQGTQVELLEQDGMFARMWRIQNRRITIPG